MHKILISRTDNLGDVVLTLPVAGVIKKESPTTQVAFLGKAYTQPIIEQSAFVDEFYDWACLQKQTNGFSAIGADVVLHIFPDPSIAQAAKRARIPVCIGTSHRLYHWWTCNRLVNLGRNKSSLHEAQLNLKLLAPLGVATDFSLGEIPGLYGWKAESVIPGSVRDVLAKDKLNVIFHIKSNKSGKEWPSQSYQALAEQLPHDRYHVLITGTKTEGKQIRDEVPLLFDLPHVKDVTGQFDLKNLIALIQHADGLLATGTGPLHIAAASGIPTLGLFPYYRPVHAGRWGPIGKHAFFLVDKVTSQQEKFLCHISVKQVRKHILAWH